MGCASSSDARAPPPAHDRRASAATLDSTTADASFYLQKYASSNALGSDAVSEPLPPVHPDPALECGSCQPTPGISAKTSFNRGEREPDDESGAETPESFTVPLFDADDVENAAVSLRANDDAESVGDVVPEPSPADVARRWRAARKAARAAGINADPDQFRAINNALPVPAAASSFAVPWRVTINGWLAEVQAPDCLAPVSPSLPHSVDFDIGDGSDELRSAPMSPLATPALGSPPSQTSFRLSRIILARHTFLSRYGW